MRAETGASSNNPQKQDGEEGDSAHGVVCARVLSQSRALKGSCTEVESRVRIIQMPRF